jgi:hypothetical protein
MMHPSLHIVISADVETIKMICSLLSLIVVCITTWFVVKKFKEKP